MKSQSQISQTQSFKQPLTQTDKKTQQQDSDDTSKTKLPDIDNFQDESHYQAMKYYRILKQKLPMLADQVFYTIMNNTVTYSEIDFYTSKGSMSLNLWAFLINYLIKFSHTKEYKSPYYQIFVIFEMNTKFGHLDYRNSNIHDQLLQTEFYDPQTYDTICAIVKKGKKFILLLYSKAMIRLIFLQLNINRNFLQKTKDLLPIEFQQINIKQKKHVKQLIYLHICPLKNPIQLNQYLDISFQFYKGKTCQSSNQVNLTQNSTKRQDQIEWLLVQTGLNDLKRKYDEVEQLELQQQEQEIQELQRQEQLEKINEMKQHNAIEEPIQRVRLDTPPKVLEDFEDQIEILCRVMQKKLNYLKSQKEDLNDKIGQKLHSQEFIIQKTNFDKVIDKELEELDNLVLMQNNLYQKTKEKDISKSMILPEMKNLQSIMAGKITEQLFDGMGMPEINKKTISDKDHILQTIRRYNQESIADPLLKPKQNHIPGIFMPELLNQKKDAKQQIIAYRYGIQISRQQILNLRESLVDEKIVDIFMRFLVEYHRKNSDESKINCVSCLMYKEITELMKVGEEYKFDYRFDQYYLQNNELILIPIKGGFIQEYSLILVDVKEFKIIYYVLCELPYREPEGKEQQLIYQWRLNDVNDPDKITLSQQRKQSQDKILQIVIMWIKQHAKYYKLKSYYDMRLWKIRIQNNAKVRSPRDSALYLLLLASLITLKKYYTFDEGVNQISNTKRIVEQVISSVGIGFKHLSSQLMLQFQSEIDALLS